MSHTLTKVEVKTFQQGLIIQHPLTCSYCRQHFEVSFFIHIVTGFTIEVSSLSNVCQNPHPALKTTSLLEHYND